MNVARVQAFLMSLLMRQHALANDKFLTRYPHSWLVWEPGPDALPGSGVDVSVAETRAGSTGGPQRPIGVDVLCFALKLPEGSAIKVGRAADNELVVSDPMVSRLHARLDLAGAEWSLVPLSETKKTTVDGLEIARGTPVKLKSGQVLELGGVKVSFYDAATFKARVAGVRKT